MESGQVRVVADSLRIRSHTPLRAALVRLPIEFDGGEGQETRTASGRWRWIETSLAAKMVGDCLSAFTGQREECASARQMDSALRLAHALLQGLLTRPCAAAPTPGRDAIPMYVIAAERHLQDPAARPVSVAELARSTGVSPRTLHDGFRKHRGASPMRFLREQKLQSVRNELLNPTGQTSVTDCALKWGFNHLGRFSSYYLKRFGEKPSDTLRHARTHPRQCPAAHAARAS
jgi:transcriptional regulator GlxA family with amidase domain